MDPGSLTPPQRDSSINQMHMPTPPTPCQAGKLRSGSQPVSLCAPVPGTSLQTGSTGGYPFPGKRLIETHPHGPLGPSIEPQTGSVKARTVSDTRGQGPPVSDTSSNKHPGGARPECLERPVSDTLLPHGAPVSDTSTMANAIDDDITWPQPCKRSSGNCAFCP